MFPIRRYYRQPTLFDEIDYDKLERYRFDHESFFYQAAHRPYERGISREKRAVDYDRMMIE